MVYPVTLKPNKIWSSKSVYDASFNRRDQVKPYTLPLPFIRNVVLLHVATGNYATRTAYSGSSSWQTSPGHAEMKRYAYNKAYERFVSNLGDSSSFGATATAERRETFGMITDFVVRILRSVRCAKRGDYLGVLHNLGFNPPLKRVTRTFRRKRQKRIRVSEEYYMMPNGRHVAKSAASSWLLWSYGVSPLLSDIQNATDVFLRAEPQHTKIKGSATERNSRRVSSQGGGVTVSETQDSKVRVEVSAMVAVSNYNLWLANQLGLVNPLQWANEAVPFSFVVDWASNWSSVINSLTDFYGLNLQDQCNSTKWATTYDQVQIYLKNKSQLKYSADYFERQVTPIKRPTLEFRYERFEWRRALNAISLLVGFLPSKSHH